MLKKKGPLCPKDCPLYEKGEGFVPPCGKGYSGIRVVGIAPAEHEIKSGIPFHFEGKAGLIFRKILAKGGIGEESLIILNTLQCRPPFDNCDTDLARSAVPYCKANRDAALNGAKCIVALGNFPFEALVGQSGVESKRGYEFWSEDYRCPVIPSIHPSFISYTKATNLIPAVLWDMKVAPTKDRRTCEMIAIEDPSPVLMQSLCEEAKTAPWVAVDIETPLSTHKDEDDLDDDPSNQIIRVSFAFDSKRAISFPWTPLHIELFEDLMRSGNDKIFWNANFDVPRLEYNGVAINGRVVDAMWLWHFLQPDLPRGLGHAATYYTDLPEWKSKAASQPAWYSCCDAYATANVYLGVREHLASRGMQQVAENDVVELLQVLRRMNQRGILVDKEALERFKKYLDNELDTLQSKLNDLAPASIRKYHPAKGYIRTPKDTTGMVLIEAVDKEGEKVQRWAIKQDFLANSSSQVKDYMKAVGHDVPFSKKYAKETTDKRFLSRYASLYPTHIYDPVLEFRRVQKLRGTYSSWPIGEDSRIHTRFSLAPATGRLSSQNPNVQNIPVEGKMADMFRDCLTASPGHVLLRRDYTGAEAILTGYFANDPAFMKLAAIGVYTYVLAKHANIPIDLNDPKLEKKLNKVKSQFKKAKEGEYVSQYKKFKTLVLGICYGLGPDQMFEQNIGVFKSKTEARQLRKFFFGLFPSIEAYQNSAVLEARTTALVRNPFGYIRWLWDVPGLDGPKAIAQKPQSSLAAIIKRAMRRIDESEIGQYLIWQIHDELVLDVPKDKLEEVDAKLKEIMEAPIPELNNLVLKTVRKEGRSMK
jgi:uracil-DNA glycosylase family 4